MYYYIIMSSILMNSIPIIDWKGQTFNQIVSHIQKNGSFHTDELNNNIFAALPLKTYRREIASGNCNNGSRNSTTIRELTRPGGSIVNSASSICSGLVNIVNFNLINNSSDIPGTCVSECVVGTAAANAKRRIRSSGMIKKQFDLSTDKPKYYTDSRQYLNSRNRTYEQNNFHYIREGDITAVPGSSLSVSNIYTTNSTTDCKRYYISNDTLFNYQWVAGNPTFAETGSQPTDDVGNVINESAGQYGNFTVNLQKGFYDVADINSALHARMILNEHYFVNTRNQSKRFFINFVFNSNTKSVELQIEPISQTVIDNEGLTQPTIETESGSRLPVWNIPESLQIPQIEILTSNIFKDVIGFEPAFYPSSNQTTLYVVASTNEPAIKPRYNRVYYKPNNSQFAQQGAVSSSSRVARLRYNAITNSAATYRNAFGPHVANALAYGVPANGYTIKDKIGYPLPNTPKIRPTGELIQCVNVSISG
jgi:hypothetical protein